MNDEYIDGLMQGSHRLTKDQIHAYAKASRIRVRKGKEAEALRKATASGKVITFKRPLEDKSL